MAEFQASDEAIRLVVVWLVAALFIHFAAKGVLGRSSFLTAMVVALIGALAAAGVTIFVGGTFGFVLAIVVWALVCAVFYRARWLQGLAIGLVAWLLFFLVRLAIDAIMKNNGAA